MTSVAYYTPSPAVEVRGRVFRELRIRVKVKKMARKSSVSLPKFVQLQQEEGEEHLKREGLRDFEAVEGAGRGEGKSGILTHEQDVAEGFNEWFSQVYNKGIRGTGKKLNGDSTSQGVEGNSKYILISDAVILRNFLKLKNRKSKGPDDIPSDAIKLGNNAIVPIYEHCLEQL
ncbi:hypothetical protein J437_LFUL011051 [Ladona fulva]|uniref:Uncharacterized protein n=1 Tax=Ladona fulva TaxID=123851 RepID=A0A8K0KB11_LADFU|nr:hypothetical protein J437_LFUL011051 [Ladona fulva]